MIYHMSENKPHDPNNDPSLDTFILAVLELNQFLVPGAASTARAAVLLLSFSGHFFFSKTRSSVKRTRSKSWASSDIQIYVGRLQLRSLSSFLVLSLHPYLSISLSLVNSFYETVWVTLFKSLFLFLSFSLSLSLPLSFSLSLSL